MPSLPTVGGDNNAWGTILNTYLSVSLDSVGALKSSAITSGLGYTPINKAGDSGIGALSLGTSNSLTAGSLILGTNPSATGAIRVPNQQWVASRNAANSADINMVRVDSSNRLEYSATLYRSDDGAGFGETGTFVKLRRSASNYSGSLQTFDNYNSARGTATVNDKLIGIRSYMDDPASVVNKTITGMSRVGTTVTVTATSHSFVNGDKIAIEQVVHTFNAEVNGNWTVANAATNTFDITVAGLSSGSYTSGGVATNRPSYHAGNFTIAPTVARTGLSGTALNGDDANCVVAYNNGSAKGTDGYYLDNNPGITGSAFLAGVSINASCDYGLFIGKTQATAGIWMNATHTNNGILMSGSFGTSGILMSGTFSTFGLDCQGGTFTTAPIRLPNNKAIVARNASNSADINLISSNSSNEVILSQASGGNVVVQGSTSFRLGAATNFQLDTTTGTKFGVTTSDKLAFWNATPIIRPSSTGETVGFTAGGGTTVTDASTFTGNVGATAYRISDIVKHLKNIGLIAS